MRFVFLLISVSICYAQGASAANSSASSEAADTSSANQAVFADINIFSQMPLGGVLILWSNFEDLDLDIKRQITSRSFVLEPYFMQNIDREQFEKNQILQLFAEQKKAFFKLFPDDEED